MFKISVCLLTYNSARLLCQVLEPLISIADELIVVDSGSLDDTINICRNYNIEPIYHPFKTHGQQMNYAISRANHDWVLCMDSDEILDEQTTTFIRRLKTEGTPGKEQAWRLSRYWFVLGEQVRTIYPVSSPDYPVRLFNRQQTRFNDRPVDDQAFGFNHSSIIPGFVRHDTFYNIHEVFNKLNSYTTRLVINKKIRPSLIRAVISAIGAFFKWYLFSGAWKKGRVGLVTGLYATFYSFLKYFKAWYQERELKDSTREGNSSSTRPQHQD